MTVAQLPHLQAEGALSDWHDKSHCNRPVDGWPRALRPPPRWRGPRLVQVAKDGGEGPPGPEPPRRPRSPDRGAAARSRARLIGEAGPTAPVPGRGVPGSRPQAVGRRAGRRGAPVRINASTTVAGVFPPLQRAEAVLCPGLAAVLAGSRCSMRDAFRAGFTSEADGEDGLRGPGPPIALVIPAWQGVEWAA